MNDIYSSSAVLLAHGLYISGSSGICLLIIMSLFVFGLLLFRIFGRTPKGLFISSAISYALVLINILQFSFRLRIPYIVIYPCFAVVYPYFYIVGFIEWLMEQLFGPVSGPSYWIALNQTIFLFLVAFIIDTLCIFAIIRLILYIKRKVSAKKPQVKQTV
jgi:hypothetical protein